MKKIYFILLFIASLNGKAQTTFQKVIGGTAHDLGYTGQQTADGGFIIVGYTLSFGAGSADVYLIRTDANGDTLWTKTFGGTSDDRSYSVQQTSDAGFIIAGYTGSFGAGNYDVYLIRIDSNGNLLWTKTFGGANYEEGQSVQQTADGGFIIVGYTQSFSAGYADVYLIRTDANDDALWTKTFGGPDYDYGYSVQQTANGGFIVAGRTDFGPGSQILYLVRTDSSGNLLWSKAIGLGQGNSVQQTTDGGFIVTGLIGVSDMNVYLTKTDSSGNLLWAKTFGGTGADWGNCVQQTADGGFIIIGKTSSFGAGGSDVYLNRTDLNGNLLWSKTIGGALGEIGVSVQQTTDGGFFISGNTYSFGAGNADVYLIKTDSMGNSSCSGNPSTITTIPPVLTSNPATQVSSGGISGSSATQTGSGGIEMIPCISTGIQFAISNFQSAINISPNPATNELKIENAELKIKEIEIYSSLGEKVFSQLPTANYKLLTVDVSQLPSGIYFITITDQTGNKVTKKVVKM